MKRHPALVPLSHDHHHALVAARRLRRAAGDPDAAAEFARFFADESVRHFRDEEEQLFPLAVGHDQAEPLIVRALLEHQRLHALVSRLDDPDSAVMTEIGELLEAHIRFEERELFPLIERLVAQQLEELDVRADRVKGAGGPVWGDASDDLNATIIVRPPGAATPEHVNDERDVFVAVLDGSATVGLEDEEHDLSRGDALIIAKGRLRQLTAGPNGVRYASVHLRRPGLQIRSAR